MAGTCPRFPPDGRRAPVARWQRDHMDVTTAIRRLQLRTVLDDGDAEDLGEDIRHLLQQLPPTERRAVVRHAYWRMPGVPTRALQQALGGDAALRDMAGRGPVIGACPCGRVVRARDRDDVDEGAASRCAACAGTASGAADAVAPRAAAAGGFGWEFQDAPVPWRPISDPTRSEPRRWAEHYPDAAGA
ncbi:hypothetical protein BH23ACT9_BH23ACT9_26460 [soil metagenome]